MNRMKEQSGFTLIELVMVIVILGILGAMAIPKFVDLTTAATDASKDSMAGAVKSALSVAIAENQAYPTLDTLVTYIDGSGITAVATGIQVTIDGTTHIAPAYTDSACSTATDDTNVDLVKCVGDIP